jgi:sigma-E factor negative regulatory protein RseB
MPVSRPDRLLARLLLLSWVAPACAGDAVDLIAQVSTATKATNYDGVFVYIHDSTIDSMRIVHQANNGSEVERLYSLSGAAREVIRDGTRVTCTFADGKAVMVEKRQPTDFLRLNLSEPVEHVSRYYDFVLSGIDRVAGRDAQILTIRPKVADRYSYRLWVDRQSNLLLRSSVLDQNGVPLEQLMFTQITVGEPIPAEALKAGLDGVGFTWYTNDASVATSQETELAQLSVHWLPGGFEMKNSNTQHIAASKMPVKHLAYSDGLSMVSVFVEKVPDNEAPLQGYSSKGAVNAFSRLANGYQVTVVGEVPQTTVRRIAASVTIE